MILKVHDERPDNEKQLKKLEPNAFFMWCDELFRRIEVTIEADIRYKVEDAIPVVKQTTGELVLINRDAWVVPVWCELHITEG